MKSRFLAQRRKLQRRTFLKAVGCGLSVPIAYKMSQMAVAAPGDRPTRLFVFFLPHGAPMEHWDTGPGAVPDFKARGLGILEPLEPYKSHVNVLRGVGIKTATNHAAIRHVITGGESNDSVDYLVANQLATTAHALGVQPYRAGGQPDSDSHFIRHGSWVAPEPNPAAAADELFKNLVPVDTPAPSGPSEAELRAEVLALTEGEIAKLQTAVTGLTAEQNKLQIHLDAIRALKAQQDPNLNNVSTSCEARPSLPTADSMRDQDPFLHSNYGKVLDGHLEAAAHAFYCGTARVITLQMMYVNAQITMDFPGGPGFAMNHHDPLSHSSDSEGRGRFAETQKWFYSRLAEKFLSVLQQTDPLDPEHTVLDNSTILCCTEVIDGSNHHSDGSQELWVGGQKMEPNHQPWLIIGGGSGYLKTGQNTDIPNTPHTDILATVAAAAGAPITTMGSINVSVPGALRA